MHRIAIAALLLSTNAMGIDCGKEFHRFWPFYKNLEKSNVEVTVDAMLSLRASCEQLDTYTTAYVNGKINDEKIKNS